MAICPKCKSTKFKQLSDLQYFECEDCKTTFMLIHWTGLQKVK